MIPIGKFAEEYGIDSAYILARYLYRIGSPYMVSDRAYDAMDSYIKQQNLLPEYTNRLYENDPIPYELIKIAFSDEELSAEDLEFYEETMVDGYDESFDLLMPKESRVLRSLIIDSKFTYMKLIEDELSLSIDPKFQWTDFHAFCLCHVGQRMTMSGKVNGVNQRSPYVRVGTDVDENGMLTYRLGCSLSRARDGREAIDYTDNFSRSAPLEIKVPAIINGHPAPEFLDIRGEVYVDDRGLDLLREKYMTKNRKFANGRVGALSTLRTIYPQYIYEHQKLLMYYCPGVSDTVYGTYKELNKMGFETPPILELTLNDVPTDLNEFKEYMLPYMKKIYDECNLLGIPTDGAVLEVNNLNEDFKVSGQYSDRACAIKVGFWKAQNYKTKVIDLKQKQNRVYGSLVVSAEPTETKDGCEVKNINVYNPDIFIKSGIRIGGYAYFERLSETVPTLIYGERLEKLLKYGELEPEENAKEE